MIIDEFLYALGFKTDTSGAKSFVSALGGVDQASQHTTKVASIHCVGGRRNGMGAGNLCRCCCRGIR